MTNKGKVMIDSDELDRLRVNQFDRVDVGKLFSAIAGKLGEHFEDLRESLDDNIVDVQKKLDEIDSLKSEVSDL